MFFLINITDIPLPPLSETFSANKSYIFPGKIIQSKRHNHLISVLFTLPGLKKQEETKRDKTGLCDH